MNKLLKKHKLIKPHGLALRKVNRQNKKILLNLAQAYEAEFSNLTKKMSDKLGKFSLDISLKQPYIGYLLYYKNLPIGFCIADVKSEVKDISEFYIIPIMRRHKFGSKLARIVFNKHPGQWQVRQIQGAIDAIKFWRFVVRKCTRHCYSEAIVNDIHWGKVTRQRFNIKSRQRPVI